MFLRFHAFGHENTYIAATWGVTVRTRELGRYVPVGCICIVSFAVGVGRKSGAGRGCGTVHVEKAGLRDSLTE